MRADGETGSGFAMLVDLFSEPLKPFQFFFVNLHIHVRIRRSGTICAGQRNRAAERFIFLNARLLDVDYGASRYVPWSAIDNHRLPSCVYVTPVSVRWW